MKYPINLLVISSLLLAGCSDNQDAGILSSDDEELILIKHGLSRIEMASKNEKDLEVGVFAGSDELIAFSLSNSGAVSMIRKSQVDGSKKIFVVDEDGDGYPDFELLIDNQNEEITKTYLEVKRGVSENLSNGEG